jgi:phage shock protein PspC (stress-responsive transcriptional regulator)
MDSSTDSQQSAAGAGGSGGSSPRAGTAPSQGVGESTETRRRQPLRRAASDRMIAGVAAGIGRYFDVDANIVRIVMVVLALASVAGIHLSLVGLPLYLAGVPLYLACWVLIPEEGEDRSIAGSLIHSAHR